jgi:short-subunit dehydrogenase
MSNKLNILITGATAGIGRHLAFDLAKKGHRVFATGRRANVLEQMRAEADKQGLDIVPVAMDVTSEESIAKVAREVHAQCGGALDVLINNAGYGQGGPLMELDGDTLKKQFDTNVFGVMAVTRAFLPAMTERRQGRVINVSSTGGLLTAPMMGAYHASKYALEALSDALRMEVAHFGVKVVVVEPGPTHTEFTETTLSSLPTDGREQSAYREVYEKSDKLAARLMKTAVGPEHVARAVNTAITSRWPAPRYIAPRWHTLPMKLVPLVPQRLIDFVFRALLGLNKKLLADKTSKTHDKSTAPKAGSEVSQAA